MPQPHRFCSRFAVPWEFPFIAGSCMKCFLTGIDSCSHAYNSISSDRKLHKSGKWFKTINFTWLVIQRQRGAVVLELASRVEGGQGVGLTLDVAIFLFIGHFFSV